MNYKHYSKPVKAFSIGSLLSRCAGYAIRFIIAAVGITIACAAGLLVLPLALFDQRSRRKRHKVIRPKDFGRKAEYFVRSNFTQGE